MITMRIKGGLGNQLFQYAAAYALSRRLEQPFQLDFALTKHMTQTPYRLDQLRVRETRLVSGGELPKQISRYKNAYINKALRMLGLRRLRCGNWVYWLETSDAFQKDFFTIQAENLYVDGYFQSEAYFQTYRQALLKQFTPAYPPDKDFAEALREIRRCNSVAIHVRRGDFHKSSHPFHYLLDVEYYRKAMAYVQARAEEPVFFWFSNDVNWVREHFGDAENMRYVSVKSAHGDIDDMMLMKNCSHIITANSTFSWWAAWLNEHENAMRIVPEKPYGMAGMIPKGWTKIAIV